MLFLICGMLLYVKCGEIIIFDYKYCKKNYILSFKFCKKNFRILSKNLSGVSRGGEGGWLSVKVVPALLMMTANSRFGTLRYMLILYTVLFTYVFHDLINK